MNTLYALFKLLICVYLFYYDQDMWFVALAWPVHCTRSYDFFWVCLPTIVLYTTTVTYNIIYHELFFVVILNPARQFRV